ncbi:hypothetical protein BJF86_12180 [Serinicoccus sp. CNJ-927]|uniref:hypothetical protein n=1 Tax=Serinicoccus sp. CNJ-927 TaxID=1904970 RepID=UPI00096025C5|nr:hypothetical protein [Serinicoccus sp. CNJ-927]OLT44521.1 hypothetical protein BJF86_12180 [Serinicoccus sp. CNJ-927]
MGRRALGWTLVLTVLGSWCLAALAVVAGVAPAQAPATRPLPEASDGPVVLVGIPGLTWDLVGDSTPTLHRLAEQGGSAALVLRGPDEVTCAADAWLTVGVGTRTDREALGCGVDATPVWDGAGAREPDLSALTAPARAGGTCVTTHGLIAEPGPGGPPVLDTDTAGLLALPALDPDCRIQLVAATPVYESDRSEVLADLDTALADLVDQVERRDGILVVSGMGQTTSDARAQALIVAPTSHGATPSLLTSGSTRQAGLVQLVDLTPTLLQLAGLEPGTDALPGAPVAETQRHHDAPATAAADLADAVSDAQRLAPWTLGALALILLPLVALGAAVRRWGPDHAPGLLTGSAWCSWPCRQPPSWPVSPRGGGPSSRGPRSSPSSSAPPASSRCSPEVCRAPGDPRWLHPPWSPPSPSSSWGSTRCGRPASGSSVSWGCNR